MNEITIIEHGIILTLDKNRRVFEDGSVAIQDNKILDVDKAEKLKKKYKADRTINARKKLVFPGLVNIHLHSGLARGFLEELTLEAYLKKIAPNYKALTDESAYAGALLSYAESIKSGVTCVMDFYPKAGERCAEAAEQLGIRIMLSPHACERPGIDHLPKFAENERIYRLKHGAANGRIRAMVGISHVPCFSQEQYIKLREFATKHKIGINIHLHETLAELERDRKMYGKSGIEYVNNLGLFGPDVIAAHCVWLTNSEIKILKETQTNVAHCPVANMKIGDGLAPIPDLLDAGINVGLGTDSIRANNNLDIFEEMKFGAIFQKGNRLDPTIMHASQMIEMTTINGAKALGLDKEIGSIEPGKKADLNIMNLNTLRLTPVMLGEHFNLVPHLVYAAHGDDIETCIIDGKIVMENRKIKTISEDKIIEIATNANDDILEKRKQYL